MKNSELVTFFHDMIKDEDGDEFLEEDDSDMEQYDLIKQGRDEDSADDSPNVVKDMAGELASKDSKHGIVLNLDGNLRGTQADRKATEDKDVKDIGEKLGYFEDTSYCSEAQALGDIH